MTGRNATKAEIEKNKKNQKMRSSLDRAARRAGKPSKPEGKVTKSKIKTTGIKRSQKKTATVNKYRR